MQALSEAIREQISSLFATLEPNSDVKVLMHNAILDHCGLLQKRENPDDDADNTEEEPRFQEEMKERLQEEEAESLRLISEDEIYKQRLKNIALVIGASGAGGWFVGDEDED